LENAERSVNEFENMPEEAKISGLQRR